MTIRQDSALRLLREVDGSEAAKLPGHRILVNCNRTIQIAHRRRRLVAGRDGFRDCANASFLAVGTFLMAWIAFLMLSRVELEPMLEEDPHLQRI